MKIQHRNPFALPAKMRRAGVMKDRRIPRGGARRIDWDWEEENCPVSREEKTTNESSEPSASAYY